jgi:hypothetical protein
VREALEHY